MVALKFKNQLHPPLPKKKRVDKLGNDRKRLYFKSGNSTMLLCQGVTDNAAKVITDRLITICDQLGTKLEGILICTK